MKKSDKIKARKRIKNGCDFPSLMKVSKYPCSIFSSYKFLSLYDF